MRVYSTQTYTGDAHTDGQTVQHQQTAQWHYSANKLHYTP